MLNWDEKYSVGIQSIDQQHHKLFDLLNHLLSAMKQGQAATVTNKIISELSNYAIIHFQKEEFFFQRFNYEGAAAHIKEHKQFINRIHSLKEDLNSGKISLSFELLNFLKSWIDHHVLEEDQKYAECFRQNGLK